MATLPALRLGAVTPAGPLDRNGRNGKRPLDLGERLKLRLQAVGGLSPLPPIGANLIAVAGAEEHSRRREVAIESPRVGDGNITAIGVASEHAEA